MSIFSHNKQHTLFSFVSFIESYLLLKFTWKFHLSNGKNIYFFYISRSFRFCCSFCVSSPLNNSSNRFDASVKVLVCPLSFNPSRLFNPVQVLKMLDGMITLNTCEPSHSSFSSAGKAKVGIRTLSTRFWRSFPI